MPQNSEDYYYLVSIKWTLHYGDNQLVFWRADKSGYTSDLKKAGKYTPSEAANFLKDLENTPIHQLDLVKLFGEPLTIFDIRHAFIREELRKGAVKRMQENEVLFAQKEIDALTEELRRLSPDYDPYLWDQCSSKLEQARRSLHYMQQRHARQ